MPDDEAIVLRFYGGPMDGAGMPVPPGQVPVTGSPVAAFIGRGHYEVSRFRGHWSGEWVPAGESSAAALAAAMEEAGVTPRGDPVGRAGEVVLAPEIEAGVDQLSDRVAQGPEPEWHRVLVATGEMPALCDPPLEHDWGPWGSAINARVAGTSSRTCSRCGMGEFRVAELPAGQFDSVADALLLDEEPLPEPDQP